MNKTKRRYTTAKAARLICALIVASGANIIYREAGWDRAGTTAYAVAFVAGQADIIGLVVYYIVYGATKTPGLDRAAIKLAALSAFLGVLILGGGGAVITALTGCHILSALYVCLLVVTGRNDGDNIIREGEAAGFDGGYFDYVNVAAYLAEVNFPLDVENYRRDRGKGYIKGIGTSGSGKYEGKICALVKSAAGGLYLCPLDRITVNGAADGVVIAEKRDENIVAELYDRGNGVSNIRISGRPVFP
jgi:hypothetical protein